MQNIQTGNKITIENYEREDLSDIVTYTEFFADEDLIFTILHSEEGQIITLCYPSLRKVEVFQRGPTSCLDDSLSFDIPEYFAKKHLPKSWYPPQTLGI